MLSYITTSRQAGIQVGRRQRGDRQGTGALMGTPHAAAHDGTCAGNPPGVDRKRTAGLWEQVDSEGVEFHTCGQLSPELQEQLSPLRLLKKAGRKPKRDTAASLEPTSVLCFNPGRARRDTPGSLPPLPLLPLGRHLGGKVEAARKARAGFILAAEAFFLCAGARGGCRSFGGT